MDLQELQSLIEKELADCTPDQRDLFARYRIPPRLMPVTRYGRDEAVFVVAQRGNEVMYYEDEEEGFNFSHLTDEGRIAEHWCNQNELRNALSYWQGIPQQRCKPYRPEGARAVAVGFSPRSGEGAQTRPEGGRTERPPPRPWLGVVDMLRMPHRRLRP